jgi:hypothetical protein
MLGAMLKIRANVLSTKASSKITNRATRNEAEGRSKPLEHAVVVSAVVTG